MSVLSRLFGLFRPRVAERPYECKPPSPELIAMMGDYQSARLNGEADSFRIDIADFHNGAAGPGDDMAMFLARRRSARERSGVVRLIRTPQHITGGHEAPWREVSPSSSPEPVK